MPKLIIPISKFTLLAPPLNARFGPPLDCREKRYTKSSRPAWYTQGPPYKRPFSPNWFTTNPPPNREFLICHEANLNARQLFRIERGTADFPTNIPPKICRPRQGSTLSIPYTEPILISSIIVQPGHSQLTIPTRAIPTTNENKLILGIHD